MAHDPMVAGAMDQAAEEARSEFKEILAESRNQYNAIPKVGAWWTKWYLKAGHKRLARILMSESKQ